MIRSRGPAAALAALTVAVFALSACDANSTGDEKKSDGKIHKGGTLTVYTSQTEFPFEPAISQSLAVTSQGLVHRRLTTWDIRPGHQPKVVPDLATTTGTPSDGGRVWTYKLKDGLTFSNGKTITSQDIKYGIERSFAPELSGGLGYHKALLVGGSSYKGPYTGKQLASITTPDAKTIVFRLNSAYGDWPWIVSMPAFAPVPKSADTKPSTYGTKPVASGPYQVQSYHQGTSATLVRNPDWSAKTDSVRGAGPDKIVFKLGQEDTVAAQQLIGDSGEARSAFGADPVPPSQLKQITANASAKSRVALSDPGALVYLAMNTQHGILKDVRVRQAIEYGVDKRAFQLNAGGTQGGSVASTLITPGIPGRASYDLYKAPAAGDVAKAKQLLAQAGVRSGTLRLVTRNENTYVGQAEAVQQSLKNIGLTAKIVPLDVNAWTDAITNDQGNYDLTVASWQPDFPSANGNIQPLFASSQIGGGNYNLSRYSNATVDTLIDKATSTVDPTAAQQLWAQADRRIMQDAPVVPLLYSRNAFMRGSAVSNFDDSGFPNYPNYLRVSLSS
ncbi:peptide/nickel transport system substrate-binding protein [Jatrophihabitans endophyticus]|uniref:Peptide/nickel transport system substrate-binding protein n=1 Tax=Jatrophihabitans endophyticus TaxID=1206085 RepID=A0A1M5KNK3_9ACTN|nr:ABC transporter substrate-binding protein [Jatrophihabitans endophyticus]SHG54367.1 peptide/nickel transport system substrate-binding protein [Jatrophihabitans endophyticus]